MRLSDKVKYLILMLVYLILFSGIILNKLGHISLALAFVFFLLGSFVVLFLRVSPGFFFIIFILCLITAIFLEITQQRAVLDTIKMIGFFSMFSGTIVYFIQYITKKKAKTKITPLIESFIKLDVFMLPTLVLLAATIWIWHMASKNAGYLAPKHNISFLFVTSLFLLIASKTHKRKTN